MAKALYVDSVAGVAGDMFAGAFVDAGLISVDDLNLLASQLGLDGVHVRGERVLRASVEATRVTVEITAGDWRSRFPGSHGDRHHYADNSNLALGTGVDQHWHVHYPDIDRFLAGSSLDEDVKTRARAIFADIAEAEASVHGVAIEKAAFHEVGMVDSVMDVVMASYSIAKVNADEVYSSPIKPGRGMITIAHGTHPVPPPASAKLLIGMPVAATPAQVPRENIELSTPTGIAIIKHLAPKFVGEMPSGKLLAIGRGSGTLDLGDYPNITQVSLVETGRSQFDLPYLNDEVVEIAFNVDDDTAEHLAWLAERLLERGALDVWQTPGTGKKSRSMICFSALVREGDQPAATDWLLRNSTTFGVRYRKWDRWLLDRGIETRTESGRDVRYKVGLTTSGEKLKEKIEFDDWRDSRD